MSEYHEPEGELDESVRDAHRALSSLMEEVEAVDWYSQRLACCTDPELRRILEHNKNEEMEHAAMLIEWLRRSSPGFEGRLRKVLFTSEPLGLEPDKAGSPEPQRAKAPGAGAGLGIGSLKRGAP